MKSAPLPSFIILGCLFLVATVPHDMPAGAAPPPEARPAPMEGIFVPHRLPTPDDAALAGLPSGSQPQVLSLYRAYVLALVRSRTPRPPGDRTLAALLDPQALAVQAQRVGAADFERFCKDFFGLSADPRNQGTPFVDPSGSFLDVLRRLQAVDNAAKFVAVLEQINEVGTKLLADSPKPFRTDAIDRRLQTARARSSDELQAYRTQLNRFKAELGLSPKAAIIPDRRSLARFRTVFDWAEAWGANPNRDLADLPPLVARLPRLEGVILGQVAAEGVSPADPKRLDAIQRAAEQIAIKNRGGGSIEKDLSQRIQKRVKVLLEVRTAYQKEGQQWLVAIQAKDRAFERMMASPPVGENPPDLIGLYDQVLQSENRLVALWATFESERLALARDLRIRPGQDWATFCVQVQGEPAATRGPDGKTQRTR